jgi:hypothetical protein
MNGTDSFHSSQYSIEHAKRHIRNLETEIAAFFSTDPYAPVIEINADRTEDVHKIKLVKPMPAALSGIAFDAINSLRASLDQAGYAIAIACGKTGGNAHFPFIGDIRYVNNLRRGRSKDLPKEIFDLMVSFKPYKGGNDLLWGLNKLCNSHKHQFVTPVATYLGGGNIGIGELHSSGTPNTFPPKWDPVKNEMIIAIVAHGTKFDADFQFHFFVAFNDIEGMLVEPSVPVLNKMLGIVESIIVALKAESRRLGIIK